jgi:hypothetical protein
MRLPLEHAHTRHPVHRRTQQLAPLSAPAPRAARTHVSRDPAPQRSGPTGPGDPRTWTCGPLATADQAGRGRGRAGQGSDRPAGHWVQCSRWWPLTGRLPSTTARPTGRQADERSPETLSEQVNQQQLPHPAHFATHTHKGPRREEGPEWYSIFLPNPNTHKI